MTNRAELLSRIDKLLAPMVVTQLKDCCSELRVSTTGRKDEMRTRVRARLEVSSAPALFACCKHVLCTRASRAYAVTTELSHAVRGGGDFAQT